ncbi:related to Beclin 1 (coiled-coil myosin-like BCL2-interacting protein) [Serendipita indica DSM 11827]|uniref:Related to Beclin 1 (Coiled-coil myosin-like BCL2-interacting protein) n=1 Tax=Serendipita indica (strain DSM 11827) TaxID=1109443 RepID=G4TZ65_SERID|nr:related to Beclin 1 (coiled-coil myosin-like BCL2-interacting protein) [Serendipita indica DSM 11827]
METLTCQQCNQPVQIDESLSDLTPSNYELIAGSIPKAETLRGGSGRTSLRFGTTPKDLLAKTPGHPDVKSAWERSQQRAAGSGSTAGDTGSLRKTAAAGAAAAKNRHRASVAGGESFVLLQESIIKNIPPASPNGGFVTSPKGKGKATKESTTNQQEIDIEAPPFSERLRSAGKLYALLSSKTEIDHPLCDDCTRALKEIFDKQLSDISREKDGYIAFEKQIKEERKKEGDNPAALAEDQRRIEQLKVEEEEAREALLRADRERAALEAELEQLEREEKLLEEEEAEFWRSHNAVMLAQSEEKAKLDSLKAAYIADSATLDRLESTNVYNDAFCIGQDGPSFGTINGLRFGRTGTVDGRPVTVDYPEINAAWGQVVLLLQVIARKLDFTFQRWRLIPMGSFSKIEGLAKNDIYELYDAGGELTNVLQRRRFSTGMAAFLDCLKQLMDHVTAEDSSVRFPETCT